MEVGASVLCFTAILVLGVTVGLAAIAIVPVLAMLRLFERTSGLARLIERYPASGPPEGQPLTRQTVKVGPARYRRCVTAGVLPQGLYLWVHPALHQSPPALIPWEEIKAIRPTILYGRQAVALSIGDPQVIDVTVYKGLFEAIRPHLSPGLLGGI